MLGDRSATCRVYEYGLAAGPVTGEELAVAEMRRRVDLWNRLVEIEQAHALARRRQGAAPSPAHQEELEQERRRAVRLATHASGLYADNADEVRLAYERSRLRGNVRFHTWRTTDGKLLYRFRRGMTWEELFEERNKGFQLGALDGQAAYAAASRGMRRRACRVPFRIRIGSGERKRPVWFEGLLALHRPIPANVSIRSVALVRHRVATHYQWKLVVTVEEPSPLFSGGNPATASIEPPVERPKAVAVDVGWRRVPNGIRVATWCDTDGGSGTLLLPTGWIEQMARVEEVQSLRDQELNLAVLRLKDWLVTVPRAPAWLREGAKDLPSGRSPSRLAALAAVWRANRFPGDEEGYDLVEHWRRRDKRRYEYEAHLRDQLLKDRRERYRRFAAEIALTYTECRLATFDLARLAARKQASMAAARHNRVLASVSALRGVIENAVRRERKQLRPIKAGPMLRKCHFCHGLNDFDRLVELVHTCQSCGRSWDQDVNACLNLLTA